MKIISYNINGIRAAIKKNFLNWVATESPDILCLQEIKANIAQFNTSDFEKLGYHCYWNSAEKKGYSGVAIMSKIKPRNIVYGCGVKRFDSEGRILRIDLPDLSVFSCYFPSGSSGDLRQSFKMDFLDFFYDFIKNLTPPSPLLVCGDYNICHQPIDIHDPVRNKYSSGFLNEEREWVTKFLKLGFIDTFRHVNSEPNNYSWWSYRANSRLNI